MVVIRYWLVMIPSESGAKREKLNTFGIYPKNSEQAFALDALMNPNISLVALMVRLVRKDVIGFWRQLATKTAFE